MADRRRALTARLQVLLDGARRRAFWIVLPLAAAGVAGVAGVVGSTALLRADAWRARANEIRSTGVAVGTWRGALVPAARAESASWTRSERAVRGLGIESGDRIALMQLVAQRAEDLGIGGVSVSFVAADTLGIETFREVDGRRFEPAPYALRVRLRSDYPGIASFIGSLPAQVDVHRLLLVGGDGALAADLVLAVFLGGGA